MRRSYWWLLLLAWLLAPVDFGYSQDQCTVSFSELATELMSIAEQLRTQTAALRLHNAKLQDNLRERELRLTRQNRIINTLEGNLNRTAAQLEESQTQRMLLSNSVSGLNDSLRQLEQEAIRQRRSKRIWQIATGIAISGIIWAVAQ